MQDLAETQEESAIIAAARAGDEDAFAKIVDAYGRRVFSYCWRMCGRGAEDLAQEVFVKLYFALGQFEPGRALSPFLFRIAHNHCLDALRRRRVPTVPIESDSECGGLGARIPDPGPTPAESAKRSEVGRAVDKAMGSLPPAYRSVLVMRHVEGLSYEEISEALNLPMATVKIRIHRGREKLQQMLRPLVST